MFSVRYIYPFLLHGLFLLPNTLSCFTNRDCSRVLVFVMRVRSRWHKSYGSKMINRLGSNPNQLAGFNRKANSKECSHGESRHPKLHNRFCLHVSEYYQNDRSTTPSFRRIRPSLFFDARGAETAAVFTRRHLKDAGESAG